MPRVGLPGYGYHSEGLHGLRDSYVAGINATMFPQVTAMAATANLVRSHLNSKSYGCPTAHALSALHRSDGLPNAVVTAETVCPTVPSRALALSLSRCCPPPFVQTLIHEMAHVMGIEARAVMNINLYHLHHGGRGGNCTPGGPGGVGGHCNGNVTDIPTRGGFLSIYGPTINIIRDPRCACGGRHSPLGRFRTAAVSSLALFSRGFPAAHPRVTTLPPLQSGGAVLWVADGAVGRRASRKTRT